MAGGGDKAIITEAANRYGVRPDVLWGLYGTETSFGHNLSTSSAGAEGPFQFEPATARSLGVNPHDFKSSAFGAAKYLSQYKGRGVGGMLSAYNAGPAGGYQQDYVTKTLQNAKSYGAGAERPVSSTETGSQPAQAAPKAQGAQPPIFNEQGFQKAQRAASSNRLLTSLSGGQELRGLLSTRAPQRSEYTQAGAEPQAPQPGLLGQHVHDTTAPVQGADPEDAKQLAGVLSQANHIAEAHVPYQWGGGHQGRTLPGGPVAPLDCSGAVSSALGINPKVSGEFAGWGEGGKGQHVTIYANAEHVFMEINGRFWGTSTSNPGGGAGWIKPGTISPDYLKGFTARHPEGL